MKAIDQTDLQKEFEYLVRYGTSHPNIVKTYGLVEDPVDGKGLVMEYISGGTLDALFQNKDLSYKIDHICSWMAQVSSAVAHMHEHNVIHRDLKPINMLLDPSYTHVKVCDFGFARVLDQAMSLRTGSWFWMAPEVMISGEYDSKCDVFSLGIVLWQLVAREKPFSELRRVNEIEYMQLVGKENRRPRKLNCITELEELMEWCWDPASQTRPNSAYVRDVFTDLCKIYPEGLIPPMEISDSDRLHPPVGAFLGQNYLETSIACNEELLSRSRKRDSVIDFLMSSRKTMQRMEPPADIPRLDRPILTSIQHEMSRHSELPMYGDHEVLMPAVPDHLPPNELEESYRTSEDAEQEEVVAGEAHNNINTLSPEATHVHFGSTTILSGKTPLGSQTSLYTTLDQSKSSEISNGHANGIFKVEDPGTRPQDRLQFTTTDNQQVEIEFDPYPLVRPAGLTTSAPQLGTETPVGYANTPSPRHSYISLVTSPGTMIQVTGKPFDSPVRQESPKTPSPITSTVAPSKSYAEFRNQSTSSNETSTSGKYRIDPTFYTYRRPEVQAVQERPAPLTVKPVLVVPVVEKKPLSAQSSTEEWPAPPVPVPPTTPSTPSTVALTRFTDFAVIEKVLNELPDEPEAQPEPENTMIEAADVDRLTEKERKIYLQQFEQPTNKPNQRIQNRILKYETYTTPPRPGAEISNKKETDSYINLTKSVKVSREGGYRSVANAQSANPCSFESGAIASNWSVANGILYVNFVNKNLATSQWTGLAFGDLTGNLEAVIFKVQNYQGILSTGLLSNSGSVISLDQQPDVEPIFLNYNSNRLTAEFQRPVTASGTRSVSLDNCVTWNFISASPMNADGSLGAAAAGKSTSVCPNQCNQPQAQAAQARNYYLNPVPERALYNNRESSRFNGLYEQNGIELNQ
ncbi:unnamed protein product, partial [Mesorhabditis spiculigera]